MEQLTALKEEAQKRIDEAKYGILATKNAAGSLELSEMGSVARRYTPFKLGLTRSTRFIYSAYSAPYRLVRTCTASY